MTKGSRNLSGSPPRRCRNVALANGYCRLHQSPEQPVEDEPQEARGRAESG